MSAWFAASRPARLAGACRIGVQNLGNGAAKPDRQILARRQRLAGGQHPSIRRISSAASV